MATCRMPPLEMQVLSEAYRRRMRSRERTRRRPDGLEPVLGVRHVPTIADDGGWAQSSRAERPDVAPSCHPSLRLYRPEGEAGRRIDRISRHATAGDDEVVGPLVRPTRCMTPNQGSAHRGRAGTAGHGDTVAEASIRHPRSKVPEREVEQTHIAVSQQSRNRRHERRTALRSSREQRFGQCTSRCDERGPAVQAGTEPCGGLPGCPSRRPCAIRQALRDDISPHLGDRARHPPR